MMDQQARTTVIRSVKVYDVSLASVLNFGDTEVIEPKANVLAVQRQKPTFWGNEGDLSHYLTYARTIPLPNRDESIHLSYDDQDPCIRIGHVHVTSLSASGVVQIGNAVRVQTESRTNHIRHFIQEVHT